MGALDVEALLGSGSQDREPDEPGDQADGRECEHEAALDLAGLGPASPGLDEDKFGYAEEQGGVDDGGEDLEAAVAVGTGVRSGPVAKVTARMARVMPASARGARLPVIHPPMISAPGTVTVNPCTMSMRLRCWPPALTDGPWLWPAPIRRLRAPRTQALALRLVVMSVPASYLPSHRWR